MGLKELEKKEHTATMLNKGHEEPVEACREACTVKDGVVQTSRFALKILKLNDLSRRFATFLHCLIRKVRFPRFQ